MKILLSAFIAILIFAGNSFADLMYVPLDKAVENSDLIIVGTLQEILEKEFHSNHGTSGQGKILVDRVIAGNVKRINGSALKTGDKLVLNYIENFPCVMGSHKRIENEKGIFLIELNDKGEIQSQDFRALKDLTEIEKIIEKDLRFNEISKKIKTDADDDTYPIPASLVILSAISLYYLLYRSRFKIR